MPASVPSEISLSLLSINADLESYASNTQKTYFVANFKQGKRPVKVALVGDLATEGINSKVFDGQAVYSFGLKLVDDDDITALQAFTTQVEEELKSKGYDDWTVSSPLTDDDRLFLKLQYSNDKKKFTVKSNLKLDVKKLDDLDLYRDQGVVAEAEVGSWYNFTAKKAGVFLKVTKVDFEQDAPPAKKTKKD